MKAAQAKLRSVAPTRTTKRAPERQQLADAINAVKKARAAHEHAVAAFAAVGDDARIAARAALDAAQQDLAMAHERAGKAMATGTPARGPTVAEARFAVITAEDTVRALYGAHDNLRAAESAAHSELRRAESELADAVEGVIFSEPAVRHAVAWNDVLKRRPGRFVSKNAEPFDAWRKQQLAWTFALLEDADAPLPE